MRGEWRNFSYKKREFCDFVGNLCGKKLVCGLQKLRLLRLCRQSGGFTLRAVGGEIPNSTNLTFLSQFTILQAKTVTEVSEWIFA